MTFSRPIAISLHTTPYTDPCHALLAHAMPLRSDVLSVAPLRSIASLSGPFLPTAPQSAAPLTYQQPEPSRTNPARAALPSCQPARRPAPTLPSNAVPRNPHFCAQAPPDPHHAAPLHRNLSLCYPSRAAAPQPQTTAALPAVPQSAPVQRRPQRPILPPSEPHRTHSASRSVPPLNKYEEELKC
jgi:hypothetical protein